MKRAMRVDKIRLAALEATLRLYLDPERLVQRLPTLRWLARPQREMEFLARTLTPAIATAVGSRFVAEATACASQVGSGALPQETIPSFGVAIRSADRKGERASCLRAGGGVPGIARDR